MESRFRAHNISALHSESKLRMSDPLAKRYDSIQVAQFTLYICLSKADRKSTIRSIACYVKHTEDLQR